MATDPDAAIVAVLAELVARLDAARPYNIGFPGATDFDYTPLAELLCRHLLNNIGDPLVDGVAVNQTKAMEREVVAFVAGLLRAPDDDWWGHVTTGGSEGNLHGLHLGRSLHPDALLYLSEQAHFSLVKAAEVLALPYISIRAEDWGELDYVDLADQLDRHRHRPAIVAATAGTTLAEAVDDVRQITRVLDEVAIRRRYIHVDAALSGIPLALLDPAIRPGFDFGDGADSITLSGHKFLGTPMPCGVVVTKASHRARVARQVGYTGSPDATLLGSRSGHTPLMLWYAIRRHGVDGLRRRADTSRELAAYLHDRLDAMGWDTYHNPHGFTVVLRTPSPAVTAKWVLATSGEWSHIITVPGVSRESIEAFIRDMEASGAGTTMAVAATSNGHGAVRQLRPPTQEPNVVVPAAR